jgi:sulfur carrier protein
MKFIVNGKETEIGSALSLIAFLESREISLASVVIEYNYEIPDRGKWHEIHLKEGDNLEIVKFIGGG